MRNRDINMEKNEIFPDVSLFVFVCFQSMTLVLIVENVIFLEKGAYSRERFSCVIINLINCVPSEPGVKGPKSTVFHVTDLFIIMFLPKYRLKCFCKTV